MTQRAFPLALIALSIISIVLIECRIAGLIDVPTGTIFFYAILAANIAVGVVWAISHRSVVALGWLAATHAAVIFTSTATPIVALVVLLKVWLA